MKNDKFNKLVDDELSRIRGLLVKKGSEYSLDADRLSHFKHAAATAEWPADKVLLGYLLKHLLSVIDMINSGKKFTKKMWEEKHGDIHAYLILHKALLEDLNEYKEEDK